MNENDLAVILKRMYDNAPEGYRVANIHLFGIKYASIILRNDYKATNIVKISGLNRSYATEVGKGIKLSTYVVPKE